MQSSKLYSCWFINIFNVIQIRKHFDGYRVRTVANQWKWCFMLAEFRLPASCLPHWVNCVTQFKKNIKSKIQDRDIYRKRFGKKKHSLQSSVAEERHNIWIVFCIREIDTKYKTNIPKRGKQWTIIKTKFPSGCFSLNRNDPFRSLNSDLQSEATERIERECRAVSTYPG